MNDKSLKGEEGKIRNKKPLYRNKIYYPINAEQYLFKSEYFNCIKNHNYNILSLKLIPWYIIKH